jgi:hypothetical protein
MGSSPRSRIAVGIAQSRQQRRFLPEVSRQSNGAYRKSLVRHFGGASEGVVATAVVDDHHFQRVRGNLFEQLCQRAHGLLDAGALVERRHDDAYEFFSSAQGTVS